MKIAIIGGGASGVICALRVKKINPNIDVTIFEATDTLLKKVSISGSGKCNISNINIKPECYKNPDLISEMLQNNANSSLLFLKELGLFTTEDDMGRVYPYNKDAKTVVRLLINKLYFNHVEVKLNTYVDKIKAYDDRVLVNNLIFDRVVIAIGSNAFLSNSLDHYRLVKNFKLKDLHPGLVGFKTTKPNPKLNGIRCMVKAKYLEHESSGEMLFKADGVSGICLMDLSLYYDKQKANFLLLDFLANRSISELISYAKWRLNFDKNLHLYNLLQTALPEALLNEINKSFQNETLNTIDDSTLYKYFMACKEYKLFIEDTYDFKAAQITVGGVCLDEIDHFKAKKVPNTYLIGEVLDEAGICGGYNLWFAMTSAIMVGDALCK